MLMPVQRQALLRCVQAETDTIIMQAGQDEKTYVTIPNKGDHELETLLEAVEYLRQQRWTYNQWIPTPALIDKTSGSSRQYVGQRFDADYFDLVEDGWTHDHCEVCHTTISNKEGYGESNGYRDDNGDWICTECYELFINSASLQETIKSLKSVER